MKLFTKVPINPIHRDLILVLLGSLVFAVFLVSLVVVILGQFDF